MTSLQKFLALIAWSEGTATSPLTKNDGYDVIVNGLGGPEVFTDYSDHPFANRQPKLVRAKPPLYSTASGRYQLLYRYWHVYKVQLHLADFSPASQDAVAVQQMKERGAVDMVSAGNVANAIHACSNIWASFPGNAYGQNAHPLEKLLAQYEVINAAPAQDLA
jgi:muramidase (phage lysozyme)